MFSFKSRPSSTIIVDIKNLMKCGYEELKFIFCVLSIIFATMVFKYHVIKQVGGRGDKPKICFCSLPEWGVDFATNTLSTIRFYFLIYIYYYVYLPK